MAQEFKTVVTVLGQLPESGARPIVPPSLETQAGRSPETITVIHPRTKRASQLFLFEYDLLHLLFDGQSAMPELLARMQELGHSVTFDQLATWIHEMARLGCLEATFGIEPSRRMAPLPWRGKPEPAVAIGNWPVDARQLLNRALGLFRDGELASAVSLLRPLVEHPQAGPAAHRLMELGVLASGLAAGAAVLAMATPSSPPPVAGQAPTEGNGFDDEDDWVAEATQVLAREDLIAANLLAPSPEPVLSKAAAFALRRSLRVALMLVIALAAASAVPIPHTLRYPCVVDAWEVNHVRASFPATLTQVTPRQGDRVAAGDEVARLDDSNQHAVVERLLASRDEASAELRLMLAGNRDELIARLRARVNGLARALGVANDRVDLMRRDVSAGRAPRSALEAALVPSTQLSADLRAARAELKLAEAGARTEDVDKAQAELDAIEAALAFRQVLMQGASLRAPKAGVVMTENPENLVGAFFKAGDSVLEIADLDRMRVTVFVEEDDFDLLATGSAVDVRLASRAKLELSTTVDRIAPEVERLGDQRVVRVQGLIEPPPGLLSPGMTGYAEIQVGWRPLLAIAARNVARWVRLYLLL